MVDLRPQQYYEYAHIKGSTLTDYSQWCTTDANGISKMLPSQQHIEQLLSSMGATPESHIILV